MTADEAIQAHREWKTRFHAAMAMQTQMNVAEITSDTCCEFGKWLYGKAKAQFAHLESYPLCVSAHTAFHVEAGKVAHMINDGDILTASKMLGHDTPYAKASEVLAIRVIAMFKQAEGV